MKNKSIRIVLPVVVFAAVLLILSCAQPTNQNANTTPKGDVCEGDIDARVDKVRAGIEKKIKDKPKLKKQFEDNKFSYVVQKSSNGEYVQATFNGELKGDDELKDLSDIVNDFDEDGCLLRVEFQSLIWSPCEYPEYVCGGGKCCS